jgi:hypothetical protein
LKFTIERATDFRRRTCSGPRSLAAIDKRHVIAVASDFGPEVRSDECRAAEPARPVGPEAPYSGVQEIRSGLEELDIMTEPLKGVEAMK